MQRQSTKSDFARTEHPHKLEDYYLNVKFISQDAIESLELTNSENEEQQRIAARLPYWKKIGYQQQICKVPHCKEYVLDTGHLLCAGRLSEMCEDMENRWK